MSISGKRVAIVGGSFAGLSFALSLCKFVKERNLAPPQIVIFEKEEDLSKKDIMYSYSISIRTDSGGCQVLEKLGLEEKARAHSTHSKGFWVAVGDSKSASKIANLGWAGSRPGLRASRLRIWKTLYDALDLTLVQYKWNTPVEDVQDFGSEGVEVTVKGGIKTKFDFVVVADGTRSLLREKLYPNEKLTFAGVQQLSGAAVVEKPIEFLEQSHGAIWTPGYSAFLSDEGNGLVVWGLSALASTANERVNLEGSRKERKEVALKWAERFPSWLQELVELTPEDKVHGLNGFYKRPHRSKGNVIFIGDACHAVTPFSANGASSALIDGFNLASELLDPTKSQTEAVTSFTAEMVPRVNKVIDDGNSMIHYAHSESKFGNFFRNGFIRVLHVAINYPVGFKVGSLALGLGILGAVGYGVKSTFFASD